MSEVVDCDVHGSAAATSVCAHIVETLRDGSARGFLWSRDEGLCSAICDSCNSMPFEDWERRKDEVHCVICVECFRRAAAINGLALEEELNL